MLTASISNKILFPLIYELNQLAIRHIHSSWLIDLPFSAEILALKEYKNSQQRLSDLVKKSLKIEPEWWDNFDSKFSRFVLMDNAELMYLIRYLGMVCVSPVVKKVIHGGSLRQLKSILGEADFEFVKKTAAFYYPQRLAGLAKVRLTNIEDGQSVNQAIETAGIRCLALMVTSEPALLKQRIVLKLPKYYAHILDFVVPEDQMEKSLDDSLSVYKIARKLINDMSITCRPIFA